MRLRLLLPLLLLALPTSAGAAYRAPCVPGGDNSPTCTWWSGKVTFVSDGDTVDVRVDGRVEQVRLTGINAMELQRYSRTPSKRRGDCHGLAAAALVDRYADPGTRVRLAAQRASSRSGRRIRRSVWVQSGGRWRDLAKLQMEAGLALWLPNGDEWAHNKDYASLAAQSIAARRGMYDPDACGRGPDQDITVTLGVNWDADGADERSVNGEYVDIRNVGTRPLSLGGWFLRDSFLRRSTAANPPGYEFPSGAVVEPNSYIRLRVGCGSNSGAVYYWCQDGTAFENVTGAPRHLGDGAYLFDTDRDLRASFIYPCLINCSDSVAGRVRVDPHPSRPEAILIRNPSDAPVDLSDHVLKLRNRGKQREYVFGYVFPYGTTIPPGDALRYRHPTDNRFSDKGGVIELRTLDDQLTDCAAWGFGDC